MAPEALPATGTHPRAFSNSTFAMLTFCDFDSHDHNVAWAG